jgi:NAD(P)-dependent dehydrogenase (short-subunit alcohol dehydrogenase family)
MSVLDKLRLDGKIAIVTGAGRGLGRAMALALADAGCDLTVAARSRDQIEETAEQVRAKSRKCLAVPTDITEPASVSALIDATIGEYGRIDVLVNNAGGATAGFGKPLEEITDEEWRVGIDTNLTGTFYCCRTAIPHMLAQGGGKIINLTSGFGLRAGHNNFMYTSAKAGLINFTRSIAMTYGGRNIQANLIAPGLFPHDNPAMMEFWRGGKFIPMGRFGKDEELGPLCVFLASELSDGMNGDIMALEGGGLAGGHAPTGLAPIVPLEGEA